MHHTTLAIWCAGLTVVLTVATVITDVRWRRIPNFLTLPAFGAALVLRIGLQGWPGLSVALGGALLAPGLLLLLHGGKGLGMGDLKLAAAIGAIVGPLLAVASTLFAAIAGGILGIVWMLKPGSPLADTLSTFSIGFPFPKSNTKQGPPPAVLSTANATMPYGVALGVGSVAALVAGWWTGHLIWFLSFVEIVANL